MGFGALIGLSIVLAALAAGWIAARPRAPQKPPKSERPRPVRDDQEPHAD
jgi:hypothetical protein